MPNMIQSFKKFRKRHFTNDPAVPLDRCGKASTAEEIAKHSLVTKDEDETKIGDDDVMSHAGLTTKSGDKCMVAQHPMEPNEIDHPIRCPHPEPCIMQDGRALKERSPSVKRRGQLRFLTEDEVHSLRWNRRAAPSDSQIYPTATAPETSLKAILS